MSRRVLQGCGLLLLLTVSGQSLRLWAGNAVSVKLDYEVQLPDSLQSFDVSGLVLHGDRSAALVAKQIVSVGDRLDTAQVVAIIPQGVIVEERGTQYLLSLVHHGSRKVLSASKKVYIDLVDVDLRLAMRLLADVGGKDIVLHRDVEGTLNVSMRHASLTQAVQVILRVNDYVLIDESVWEVRKHQANADQQNYLSQVSVPLQYANAQDMLPHVQSTLGPDGQVTADQPINTLHLVDAPKFLARARKRIGSIEWRYRRLQRTLPYATGTTPDGMPPPVTERATPKRTIHVVGPSWHRRNR
jgi:hypothetical protein